VLTSPLAGGEPRIERLLYMCQAAQSRERLSEPATRFHANCRGQAQNDGAAIAHVPDPDGRFRAGRHVCICPCHALTIMPGRHR
jgi:hypothetical protein